MRNQILFVLIIVAAVFSGCKPSSDTGNSANASNAPKAEASAPSAKSSAAVSNAPTPETKATTDKAACVNFKIDGKKLIASQTFVFDHEPFKGACFVTFANREDMVDETDVPRGSTFHIYRDGKKVYDFPDAFAGTQACWVEAVAFNDLNSDGKTDVVIAGKCLAARDSYPQNAVFVNNGDKFTTDEEANDLLSEATTVKAIEAIVKKNSAKFF